MAQRISIDDVDRVDMSGRGPLRIAETMIEWAENPEQYELDEVVRPVHLYLIAADRLESLGDLEGAWALAEKAAAHPSAGPFEAHPNRISIRLEQGRIDEARALADEIRHSSIEDISVIEQAAESFELADLLTDAQRWNAIGIRVAEQLYGEESEGALRFTTARYRVRRAAALPRDVLDLQLEAWRDHLDLPVPSREL
jgi:tetratricopeptide (TPR) repeat protein